MGLFQELVREKMKGGKTSSKHVRRRVLCQPFVELRGIAER